MWQKSENPAIIRAASASLISFAIIVLFEIQFLSNTPWLGIELQPIYDDNTGLLVKSIHDKHIATKLSKGDILVAIKSDQLPYIPLSNISITEDPEQLATFKKYNQVFSANAGIFARLTDDTVTLKTADVREISITPLQKRNLSTLPLNFWISNITALVGLFFSVLMWSYREQHTTTRLLALTGFCFAVGSTAIAVSSSRGIAIAPEVFRWLAAINELAKPMVAYSLLALILIYPHRLASDRAVLTCLLIAVLSWLNNQFQWLQLPLNTFYFSMVVAFLAGIPALIKHWHLSTNKPIERASLMWMLLPIYIAAGGEVVIFMLPTFFGETNNLPAWLAQTLFLPLYFGFMLGVFRYHLFEVERWWLISWLWILSGLFVISIDLALVWLLRIDPLLALSVVLIIASWVYFPFRQWLWNRIGHTPTPHLENHLNRIIDIFVGCSSHVDLKDHWRALLERAFSVSSAEIGGDQINAPHIEQHGMNLLVPGINGDYHIELLGKNRGTRLFNQKDIELVNSFTNLVKQIQTQHQAETQGAKLERNRIMRDLHDDVGANLVSMIYRARDKADAELAKETLALLRETIYTLDDNTSKRLPLAIAKWRQEAQQRCMAANIHLDWQVGDIPTDYQLSAREFVNLGRVLREILTNALKHAHPSHFSVRFSTQEKQLDIQIEHDGHIQPLTEWVEGKGILGMRARIQELDGVISWTLGTQLETHITIHLHREQKYENIT